jgi:uncharacterized protein (TIGR03083 family)
MTRIPCQVKVARGATEWLRDELSTLTPEQWQTPNACGVWSVADVAAHLVWVADLYSDGIRRALADDVEPSRDVTAPTNASTRHAEIAEIAFAYRDELGDQVLDRFSRANLQLVELFEGLAPEDWDRPAYHPAEVAPIRRLLSRHVLEVCVHGWDLLHQLGRDVALPDGSYEPIIEMLPSYIRGRFLPRERLLVPERYRFVLDPPVSGAIHLTVYGDRFVMGPTTDGAEPDGVLTMNPQTYVLLLLGRLGWWQAIDRRTVAVTGHRDVAVDVSSWFGLT